MSADEFERLDSYCRDRSDSSGVSSNVVDVLKTINSDMAAALQSCLSRAGMWGWMTLSEGGEYVTLHLRYRPLDGDSKAQLELFETSSNLMCSPEGIALAQQPFANLKRAIRCERRDNGAANIVINTSADLVGTDGAFYVPPVRKQEQQIDENLEVARRGILGQAEATQWLRTYRSEGGQLLTPSEVEESIRAIKLDEAAPYHLDLPLCDSCNVGLTFRCSEQVTETEELEAKKVRVSARRSLVELINGITAGGAVALPYAEVYGALEVDIIQCVAFPKVFV